MGKVRKTHRRKTFDYNKNRRKAWIKSKKMPTINCSQMKSAWNEKRTVDQNMRDMGLSVDPNKSIPIPSTKELMESGPAKLKTKKSKKPIKKEVIQDMELEANQPQERKLKFSDPESKFCIYMMEKYGDDYQAMAKDRKNYYQETPKQIKRKINTFKNIPGQYKAYLLAKEKGELDTS